jgi:hypothetical protein
MRSMGAALLYGSAQTCNMPAARLIVRQHEPSGRPHRLRKRWQHRPREILISMAMRWSSATLVVNHTATILRQLLRSRVYEPISYPV